MLGLRCIYGYLIIYLVSNHLKRSVYSSDPNDTGEGTSNSTLLPGSGSQEGATSQLSTPDQNLQPNQQKAEDGKPKEGDAKTNPVTSVTLIDLDINTNQTTDQYNISDHNGVVKFTPKSSYVFGKVSQGSIDIWKSKGDLYLTLAMTRTVNGFKYLVVLQNNNTFKLFKLDCNEWKDITSTRHDITMLKFIGHNDAEIKATDYIVSIFDLSYEFTFKSGVNCRKIMYGEDDLWKSGDDNKFSEIKSLSLSLITNIFFVSNKEFESKQLTKAKLTLDIDKTESTDQYYFNDQNGLITFKPNSGYVFSKVSQGTNDIWESKDNLCGTLVSTKSEDNKKYLAILLDNNMFSLFHFENNQWQDITDQKYDITKLKFLGDNDTEVKSSDLEVSLSDLSYTFLFKSDVNCRTIMLGEGELWTHTDDTKFADINSFSMGLASNDFFVKNQSDESKKLDIKITLDLNTTQSTNEFDCNDENGIVTYTPKTSYVFNKVSEGTNVIWQSKDGLSSSLVRTKSVSGVKYLAVLMTNNMFTLFNLDDGEWKEITSNRHDVTKLNFLGNNDTELTTSDYTLTIVDLSYQYTFNSGVICRKVKLGGGDVWKHSDYTQFADIKSFQLDLITNSFFVKNFSDQIMHIGAKISLDIQKTESTDDYEYFKDDDCHTFTPKSGHIFNKISEGTKDIWESSDCLYGSLVRTKVSKDVKYLAMLLTNDMFKVFKLDGDEWQDVTNHRHDVNKLKFLGEGDTEFTFSDYTVSIVDLLYTFTFNSGVNCKMITYCDDEVWNHTDDTKFSDIKKFRLGLVSNSFFVLNASEFKKVGIKVSLDIDKTESTEKYHFNEQKGVVTYTPNSGYVFNKVFHGTTVIWESKDNVLGTLAATKSKDGVKYLALLLDNNKFLLFKEESDGTWHDITSMRLDISKLRFVGEGDTELKSSDYSVTIVDCSYRFKFKAGVSCRAVKYSDLDVWNHTDDPEYAEINSLQLDLSRNKFYINNSSDEKKEVDIKVSVDIDKTQNTNEFQYFKDGDYQKYVTKVDYAFNKVIKGTTLVWESSDDVYGTLVVTKTTKDVKFLALLLKNNTFVLLYSSDKGKNWNDITSERHDVTKLKFLDDTDNELTASDYTVTIVFLSFTYTFKADVKCVKVTYNDIPIWNHTDDLNYSEIKSLTLGLITNKFFVKNSSDQYKELKDITLVALNVQRTECTDDYDFNDQSGLFTYKVKDNHVFNKIVDATTDIWESKNDLYSTLVMTKTVDNDKYLAILLSYNTFKLFHQESGEWTDITKDRYDITKLKFFRENHSVLTSSDYTVTIVDLSFTYTFKADVKCVKVTYNDIPLWSHTDDLNFSEIKSLTLGLITNKFIVKNLNDHKKELKDITLVSLDIDNTETTEKYDFNDDNGLVTFTPKVGNVFNKVIKHTKDIWESSDCLYGTLVVTKAEKKEIHLVMLLQNDMFTLLHSSDKGGNWNDITNDKHDVTKLKFFGEGDTLLTSSDYTVSIVDYSYTFSFNDGVSCRKITYNNIPIWKHTDDSKFAEIKSFSLSLISNNFFVFNNESESKKIDFKGTQVSTPTKVTADIDKTESTDQCDFNDHSRVVTFKPKPGHVFNKVSQGTNDIWESKNDLYGTLVRTKTSKGVKYLVVLLDNNMFKLFHLDNNQWKDITSTRHDITKLKFLREGDTELTSSDYKVTINFLSYEITFNSGVNCKKIKLREDDIWKHDPKHGDKYPTSVSFNNLNRNYLVVESSRSYRNIFQFQNNEFKLLDANQKLNYDCNSTGVFDPSKLKFMTTDPSDPSQLIELDYTKYTVEHPSFITYKFNSALCKEIGYENQLVWKYDENEHSDDFPTTFSINLKKSYAIVDSSHFYRYVYSYYDKKWKELPFGYKTTNISFDKFKLLTNDPIDQNKLVELDHSQYEMEYSQNVLAIKFNTNVKCTCIMYDKKDVWKYKHTEHEGRYPTTTVFNKKKSIVLVDSGYHYRYLYIYQNKEWKPLPYGYTLKFRSSEYQLFDTKKLQIFTMDKNKTLVLMSINEYDKEDTPTLVSYIFRYSKNCHCVKYDQKVVWEYKQDEHRDKYPRISLNKKTNIMLIESGYDYRYMFQFENGEWKLLPFSYRFKLKTDIVEPDKIKLLTDDPSDQNKLVELEKSKYEREDSNNAITFKIQNGVMCTSIRYDDNDVWKYNRGEHVYKYPTKISLNKNKKFLFVESGYDYRYLYHFENGEWKLLPFGSKFKSTQSYAFDPGKFKLCSIDLSNKPFELDSSKYDRVPNGSILTYTLNPDVKCTEVKYDNISAWNYDDDEHENNYPTTIIFNRNNGFLIVESKDHYESYYSHYDNKWHSVYGYKASKITKYKEFYKLKLYETNDDGLLEPITGFHEEVTGPVITCNIFYGVKCTHVKYDEKTAWAYDYEKHMDHYPTSVVFNITNSTIKVECQDRYVYFSTFINEEWKPFSGFRTQRTNARREVKLYQKDKSGKYLFINPSKYNVNWDGENDVYEYDLNNLNCALLKHYENTVWSQTSDEHPRSITYNSDQSKFVLRFDHEYIFCSFEDNEWKKMSRRYGTQSTKQQSAEPSQPVASQAEDSTAAETEDKEPEPAIQPETEQDSTQPETEQDSTQTETERTNEQETEETEEPKQESSQPETEETEESTTSPEEPTSD